MSIGALVALPGGLSLVFVAAQSACATWDNAVSRTSIDSPSAFTPKWDYDSRLTRPRNVPVARWHASVADPVFGGALVLFLAFQPNGFADFGYPLGVIFLLLNIGRQEKLHGSRRKMAQRFEQARTDRNGNVVPLKAELPRGFAGVGPSGQRKQIKKIAAFGVHTFFW